MSEDSRVVAKSGFTWVIGARKLLTVNHLQHDVAINAGQKSWTDSVSALSFNFEGQFDQALGHTLEIDHDRLVRFAYQTIKELLTFPPGIEDESTKIILARFRVNNRNVDVELAKACLVVLIFRDFVRLQNVARETFGGQMQNVMSKLRYPDLDPERFRLARYDFSHNEDALSKPTTTNQELKRTLNSTSLNERGHELLSC
jgi:hypothetical protein